jgi:hypothetical protein
MAAYKSAKKASSPVVGTEPVKTNLRETAVGVANSRSQAYPETKRSGIKIRGTGAATRGVTARGPMA